VPTRAVISKRRRRRQSLGLVRTAARMQLAFPPKPSGDHWKTCHSHMPSRTGLWSWKTSLRPSATKQCALAIDQNLQFVLMEVPGRRSRQPAAVDGNGEAVIRRNWPSEHARPTLTARDLRDVSRYRRRKLEF